MIAHFLLCADVFSLFVFKLCHSAMYFVYLNWMVPRVRIL